jgi:hypothetical protein
MSTASAAAAEEAFAGWTDRQLKDYLKENGAAVPLLPTRAKLVQAAVRAAAAAEEAVRRQPRAGPSTLPLAAPPHLGPVPPPPPPQQQQLPPQPGVPRPLPPPGGPRRKALLVGCNYLGSSSRLSGCINDARCMHHLLVNRMGFPESQVLLMADDHPDPLRRPTKANILNGLLWLMAGLRPGDSLVFHFSGHGSQQRDFTGLEVDGLNECLLPLDHRAAGVIVDDELNRILVNPLPPGVKLHAIIDACHSGSALDLPFTATCHAGYLRWESEYRPGPAVAHKATAGGFCVQLGASRDFQTAADTSVMSGGVPTGAATYSFIAALERRGLQISYGALLVEMYNTLQAAGLGGGGGGGGGGGFLDSLLGGGGQFRGQEPVLSCGYGGLYGGRRRCYCMRAANCEAGCMGCAAACPWRRLGKRWTCADRALVRAPPACPQPSTSTSPSRCEPPPRRGASETELCSSVVCMQISME